MTPVMLLASAALAAPALPPLVAEGEDLWAAGDFGASNSVLDRHLVASPGDAEAIWRRARNIYSEGEMLAEQGATPAERILMYEKMEQLVTVGLDKNPGHGALLHWYGTAMGRKATAKGVLSSLFMADDIEDAWMKAANAGYTYRASNDTSSLPGDVYFALGQFYRLCPDWTVVKLLTGTKGDIDKSISWLRKAVQDSPQRIEVQKELGVSLLCKAHRDGDAASASEGRRWLNKAAALPVQKKTDEVDKRQIPVILARPMEACGYSRDGWQDVSREAYDKRN
ncbi:MAG: hypothetical protein VX265_01930 [Myxococcota bacterium]|nr:hypothetical protein [Myxococcota bacterium]MEC8424830.1 hypothetical protein [Myxococcota bacterium]